MNVCVTMPPVRDRLRRTWTTAAWLLVGTALLAALSPAVRASARGDVPARALPARTAVPRAVAAADAPLAVRVTSTELGQPLPAGFLGLSLEYPAVEGYLGRDPNAPNPLFLALVRALNPGQSPILRIGGDSTDASWWPVPGMQRPAGIKYTLTPRWLAVTRSLARALDAHLILGINLAADSPALAADEAHALLAGIGRRYVEALEIGNEADVYSEFSWYQTPLGQPVFARQPSYDMGDYIGQFSRWRAALPAVPLAGPAFAQSNWMPQLGSLLAAEPQLAIVTFHRYPLRACEHDPTFADFATIPNLLSDAAAAGLADGVASFVAVAHAAGRKFRVDELNSASCKGRAGVSNTFASAVWILDTLFNLAAVGVDGVNIHTLPRARYAPFSFVHSRAGWRARVRPLYYGMLMFARAFPAGARLLSVQAPAGPLKAWATLAPDGRVRVVLINKDPARAARVTVQLPASPAPAPDAVSLERLSAPSPAATGSVSLGGESFGASTASALLPASDDPAQLSPSSDGYLVSVPAGDAVMLTS